MFRRLLRLWTSWRLQRDIAAGRVLRGRQDTGGSIVAEAELEPVLTMRVYRAETDEWEDV